MGTRWRCGAVPGLGCRLPRPRGLWWSRWADTLVIYEQGTSLEGVDLSRPQDREGRLRVIVVGPVGMDEVLRYLESIPHGVGERAILDIRGGLPIEREYALGLIRSEGLLRCRWAGSPRGCHLRWLAHRSVWTRTATSRSRRGRPWSTACNSPRPLICVPRHGPGMYAARSSTGGSWGSVRGPRMMPSGCSTCGIVTVGSSSRVGGGDA